MGLHYFQPTEHSSKVCLLDVHVFRLRVATLFLVALGDAKRSEDVGRWTLDEGFHVPTSLRVLSQECEMPALRDRTTTRPCGPTNEYRKR
ncbi:hypothetical protein NDU88_005642 [Pleurodeles waltl]|uniref:Uncharacterized protein n=1 Tax=Pleurodeles waltl TaxID=8319 RepID=A0AAV7UJU3_PLEWA|nr:hypothetical protein NDU88_005642 [Pleurodeles waltl]